MQIVLDNARDEQQVRPLPAAPGCLVIVTSRRQLAGLAATDGAQARQAATLQAGPRPEQHRLLPPPPRRPVAD